MGGYVDLSALNKVDADSRAALRNLPDAPGAENVDMSNTQGENLQFF